MRSGSSADPEGQTGSSAAPFPEPPSPYLAPLTTPIGSGTARLTAVSGRHVRLGVRLLSMHLVGVRGHSEAGCGAWWWWWMMMLRRGVYGSQWVMG